VDAGLRPEEVSQPITMQGRLWTLRVINRRSSPGRDPVPDRANLSESF
jgi:hypothetical protein